MQARAVKPPAIRHKEQSSGMLSSQQKLEKASPSPEAAARAEADEQ